MNRLASAFSYVKPCACVSQPSTHPSNAPSLGSHTTDPPRPSPLESTFSVRSDGEERRRRSVSPHAALYDDPRQVYFPDGSWGRAALTLPRRPGLLRQQTDEGLSRSATPRPRSRDTSDNGANKAVKVNLLAERGQSSRGWGMNHIPGSSRITAMAAGPDGRYAVGGNQCESRWRQLTAADARSKSRSSQGGSQRCKYADATWSCPRAAGQGTGRGDRHGSDQSVERSMGSQGRQRSGLGSRP